MRARRGLGIPLQAHVDAGRIRIQQIDPAELSPGEFTHHIRRSVEADGARVVVIDSLNGYLNAMPEERFLVLQMHELLSYLNQLGVVTILVLAQHGLIGPMQTPIDISYLSDTVLMLRYFEAAGHVRRALSVVKKRSGPHEDTIREFRCPHRGWRSGRRWPGSAVSSPALPPTAVARSRSCTAPRMTAVPDPRSEQVLVLAPIGRDAPAAELLLRQAGISAVICSDAGDLLRRLEQGAGAALVAEEGFGREIGEQLVHWVEHQPPWSDFPFVVLTSKRTAEAIDGKRLRLLSLLKNVSLLERPVHAVTLVSAVQAALRARRRQYEVRGHLLDRERGRRAPGEPGG